MLRRRDGRGRGPGAALGGAAPALPVLAAAVAGGPSATADGSCGQLGILVLPVFIGAVLLGLLALGVAVVVLALGLTGPALGGVRWLARSLHLEDPHDPDDPVDPRGAHGVASPHDPGTGDGVAWLLRERGHAVGPDATRR